MRSRTARLLALVAAVFLLAAAAPAQERCLNDDEIQKAIKSVSAAKTGKETPELWREMLDLRQRTERLLGRFAREGEKDNALVEEMGRLARESLQRVCSVIRESGWPTKSVINNDGYNAFLYLISHGHPPEFLRQMLPVLIEAGKQNLVELPLLATLVDEVRVGFGLPQVFGTQAALRDQVVYIQPLVNRAKVDEWRAQYRLPPLFWQIQKLEKQYMLPVLVSPRLSIPALQNPEKIASTSLLGFTPDEDTVRVNTQLVRLNVRVMTGDQRPLVGSDLIKEDFAVYENGVQQEISFFSATDQPFDLVLVLDFSQSTAPKRNVIVDAAKRFIQISRPMDRVAIVVLGAAVEKSSQSTTDSEVVQTTVISRTGVKILSPLTTDKKGLSKSLNGVNNGIGSPIWESLAVTYDKIINKDSVGRRSAIIFMTDADDNSSSVTFADAMELARKGETTIYPIFVWADPAGLSADETSRLKQRSELMLSMLAEETGAQAYRASRIDDLGVIYEQVLRDLSRVYSIAYESRNETLGPGWRTLTVKVGNHSNLVTKTRRGYYAN